MSVIEIDLDVKVAKKKYFFEYFDNFETVEINKEIDIVNLKKNWDEFISYY